MGEALPIAVAERGALDATEDPTAIAAAVSVGVLVATLVGKGVLTETEGEGVFGTAEALLRQRPGYEAAADVVRSMFFPADAAAHGHA